MSRSHHGAAKFTGKDLFRSSKKSILGVSVLDITYDTWKIRLIS